MSSEGLRRKLHIPQPPFGRFDWLGRLKGNIVIGWISCQSSRKAVCPGEEVPFVRERRESHHRLNGFLLTREVSGRCSENRAVILYLC